MDGTSQKFNRPRSMGATTSAMTEMTLELRKKRIGSVTVDFVSSDASSAKAAQRRFRVLAPGWLARQFTIAGILHLRYRKPGQ